MTSSLYESDIVAWYDRQTDALFRRAMDEIDWEKMVEQLEFLADAQAAARERANDWN